MLATLGTYASIAAVVKQCDGVDLLDTLASLRKRLGKLAEPRLFLAQAVLLHVLASTMRGAAYMVGHPNSTLACLGQLLRSKTVEPRRWGSLGVVHLQERARTVSSGGLPFQCHRIAIQVLSRLAASDRSAFVGPWCAKWGWFPVLQVIKKSNVTQQERLMVASMLTEVSRDDNLVPHICTPAAIEVVYLLTEHTQKFLMGNERAAFSRHRQGVKKLQSYAASLVWVICAHQDPGLGLFSVDFRVSTVLHFLNSALERVATAGAALVSIFASSKRFTKRFVDESGVTTLLRRARLVRWRDQVQSFAPFHALSCSNKLTCEFMWLSTPPAVLAQGDAAHGSSGRLIECVVAALAPLAKHHAMALWKNRADEWLTTALALNARSKPASQAVTVITPPQVPAVGGAPSSSVAPPPLPRRGAQEAAEVGLPSASVCTMASVLLSMAKGSVGRAHRADALTGVATVLKAPFLCALHALRWLLQLLLAPLLCPLTCLLSCL